MMWYVEPRFSEICFELQPLRSLGDLTLLPAPLNHQRDGNIGIRQDLVSQPLGGSVLRWSGQREGAL